MKSDAQALSGQAVTATVEARQMRRGGAVRGMCAAAQAVADQGKIRLGGAFRLPVSRKTA
jgi:hypothetical protein